MYFSSYLESTYRYCYSKPFNGQQIWRGFDEKLPWKRFNIKKIWRAGWITSTSQKNYQQFTWSQDQNGTGIGIFEVLALKINGQIQLINERATD